MQLDACLPQPILSELSAETLGGTKEPAADELDLDSKLLDLSGLA